MFRSARGRSATTGVTASFVCVCARVHAMDDAMRCEKRDPPPRAALPVACRRSRREDMRHAMAYVGRTPRGLPR